MNRPVNQLRPGQSVAELLKTVRLISPPKEQGDFRAHEFVEIQQLDPTIQLNLRYATADNFLAVPIYSEPRALLQRPAAESLVAAHRRLRELGFGLLIFDAYRPWYVTKLFWELTPDELHEFVADPAKGSGHNRGTSVDVTLFELQNGREVQMPSDYDEFSERSRPSYQAGPEQLLQLRDTLRAAMEKENFVVHPAEWWHFDFRTAVRYPLCNESFSDLVASQGRAGNTDR